MVDATDKALMERWAAQRDADAFREVVSRYAGLVYATCRRILRNPAEAEDVAQECFLALASGRPPGAPVLGPWLHRLATYRSLDRLKREKRRERREREYAARELRDGEPTWDDVAPLVDAAIAALPDELRVPLVRHFLEGHSYSTLARVLDVPKSTLARRVQEGLERVRASLKTQGVGLGVAALASLLGRNAAEAAPATLTATLGRMAVAGTSAPIVAPALIVGGTAVMVKKMVLVAAVALGMLAVLMTATPVLRWVGKAAEPEAEVAQSAPLNLAPAPKPAAGAGPAASAPVPAEQTLSRPQASADSSMSLLAMLLARSGARAKAGDKPELSPVTSKDLPETNGMRYFLLAVELMPDLDEDWIKEQLKNGNINDPRLKGLFDSCQASFDAIRTGLEVGNAMLPPMRGPDEPLPYLAKWRALARLMALEADLYASQGDYASAFADYATLMEFANESTRGGVVINGLVGCAMQQIAADALQAVLPGSGATAQQYRDYLARMEAIQASRNPLSQSVEYEFEDNGYWLNESFDAQGFRALVTGPENGFDPSLRDWAAQASPADIAAAMSSVLDSYRNTLPYFQLPYYESQAVDWSALVGDSPLAQGFLGALRNLPRSEARLQAEVQGTMIQAALEGYRIENGAYPASLDTLTPGFLTQVPQDPFTGGAYGFSLGESGYTLYSAGTDMRDDGGTLDDWDETGGDLLIHGSN